MSDSGLKDMIEILSKLEGYYKSQTEATLQLHNSYMIAYEALRDSPEVKFKEYLYIAADCVGSTTLCAILMLMSKLFDIFITWIYPNTTIGTKIAEYAGYAFIAITMLYLVAALAWDFYDKIKLKMLRTSLNISMIEGKKNEAPN